MVSDMSVICRQTHQVMNQTHNYEKRRQSCQNKHNFRVFNSVFAESLDLVFLTNTHIFLLGTRWEHEIWNIKTVIYMLHLKLLCNLRNWLRSMQVFDFSTLAHMFQNIVYTNVMTHRKHKIRIQIKFNRYVKHIRTAQVILPPTRDLHSR